MKQIGQHKRIARRFMVLLLILGLAACDSGGSSSSGSDGIQTLGRTAVTGNVSSSSFSSSGGVSGITVAVGDSTTRTDSAGKFNLSNVPAGSQTIVFSRGGEQAAMKVNVASGGTLTISNVKVGRNSASGGQSSASSSSSSSSRKGSSDRDDRKGSSDDDGDDDD